MENSKNDQPLVQEPKRRRIEEEEMECEEKDSFTPREYQIELFEKALKRNTIVQLGTGAGKTFIAVMVTKELSWQVKKPFREGGKRTVFLTKTVPLVHQQSKVFAAHTDLSVGAYVGAMNVDLWTQETWESELEKNQMLVMTSQILSNILNSGFIKLNTINLLIIDECHHAVGSDPVVEVMKRFLHYPKEDHPKVLGLTASAINKKCTAGKVETQVTKEIISLEKTLMATLDSANNSVLANRHSTKPIERLVTCQEENTEYLESENIIHKLLIIALNYPTTLELLDSSIEIDDDGYSELMSPRIKLSYFPKELLHILNNMGLWCTYHLILIFLKDLDTLKKDMSKEHEKYFIKVKTTLVQIKQYCDKLFDRYGNDQLKCMKEFSKEKVCRLIEILNNFKDKKNANIVNNYLCSIIFVEQRTSAWALSKYLQHLKEVSEEFDFIKADYVVGHGCDPLKIAHLQMKSRKQEDVIKKFRAGVCNVLIATRVVEEGMDVPQCNLVIKFDEPKDFRSYVQSKGRARSQNSHYIILTTKENQMAAISNLNLFNEIEAVVLPSLCKNRELPSYISSFEHLRDDQLPPYIPGDPQGAVVTMNSAIGLVNRYCSKLPKDRFTKLVPKYNFEIGNEAARALALKMNINVKVGDVFEDFDDIDLAALNTDINSLPLFYCQLKLPVNSAIKEIIKGHGMASMKLAKRAVALKACELLHRSGELNDNLLPVGKDDLKFLNDLIKINEETVPGNSAKPGTKKRRQIYSKKASSGIARTPVTSSTLCKLYKISFTISNVDDPSVKYLKQPLDGLGFLSSEALPKFPPFPIHPKPGIEMTVELVLLQDAFIVNKLDIKKIQDFHRHLFSDILHSTTPNMLFDPLCCTCYVIPLINVGEDEIIYTLDWMLIDKVGNFEKNKYLLIEHLDNGLLGAVVQTNYRQNQDCYIVQAVEKSMTPLSPFPNPEFKTFWHYYKEKYDLNIKDFQQALLIVQPLSVRSNMLPVAAKRTRKDKKLIVNGKEYLKSIYLIPELCTILPFQATFLEKSHCVPSILYRFSQMQMALSLQQEMTSNFLLNIRNTVPQACTSKFIADCQQQSLKYEQIWGNSKSQNYPNLIESDYAIPISTFIQALTTRAANDHINLERLEIIGDSFLKYITTIYLFYKYKEKDEGKLTSGRSTIVSNSHLYHLAKQKEMPQFMSATPFSPVNEWLPPGFYIPENYANSMKNAQAPYHLWKFVENEVGRNLEKEEIWNYIKFKKNEDAMNEIDSDDSHEDTLSHNCTIEQVIPDKSIADSMEALIGAYLLHKGSEAALQFMMWLGIIILPCTESANGIEVIKLSIPRNALISRNTPILDIYNSFSEFEVNIGYQFKEKSFLLQAFTHPSYYKNKFTDCYQRLEFLGDAVLDYLITWYLFKDPNQYSPGDLSDLRSALVSNSTFAELAFKNGFHKYLKYLAPKLLDAINKYQALLELEEKYKSELYFTEEETVHEEQVEVPKALGDIFESVAGAIYLDSGFSLDAVWEVYFKLMRKVIEEFRDNIPKPPVRQVHEMFPQAKFSKSESIQMEDKSTCMVTLTVDNTITKGYGINSKVAKLNAAKQLLRNLKNKAKELNCLHTENNG